MIRVGILSQSLSLAALGGGFLLLALGSMDQTTSADGPLPVAAEVQQPRSPSEPTVRSVRVVHLGPFAPADAQLQQSPTAEAVAVAVSLVERSRNSGLDGVTRPLTTDEGGISDRLLHLNAASKAELDGLGAGRIGGAIIAGRPYASPAEHVERRILTQSDFAPVEASLTVR